MLSRFWTLFVSKKRINCELHHFYIITKSLEENQSESGVVNLQATKRVIRVLKALYRDERIALEGCRVVSMIALIENHSEFMASQGILNLLCKILKLHKDSPEIISKASAGIWNVLGTSDNVQIPENCCDILFQLVHKKRRDLRVVHTIIGALSNISIASLPDVKRSCGARRLVQMKKIVSIHSEDEVYKHFGAFVANICVDELLCEKCILLGFVEFVITLIRRSSDSIVLEYLLAGLHNLADDPKFVTNLCVCGGVEILRKLQNAFRNQTECRIHAYITAIFQNGRFPPNATTGLHVAATHCSLRTMLRVLTRPATQIDAKDLQGKTACELAMQYGFGRQVKLLVACGAQLSPLSYADGFEQRVNMRSIVKTGRKFRIASEKQMQDLINQNCILNLDMSIVIIGFLRGVELLMLLPARLHCV